MRGLELEATGVYDRSGFQAFPPLECVDADAAFASLAAMFHNAFIPFADWVNVERSAADKLRLSVAALQELPDYMARFEHEWDKIRH